ncbi:MAG: hypothetical protein Q8P44_10975 [Dehalococcoidia bacterium]|nr:hypothetical protein [Dehalococcoidia bacterium]
MKFAAFDLEGPLVVQDNAYELMKLFPHGDRVFEVISRYDDLLTLDRREGYEPGDTLALIVPFLVFHNITEADIGSLAERAILTPGAADLLGKIRSSGWETFCITTSYSQYAQHIAGRLGQDVRRVASTPFPLDSFRASLLAEDFSFIEQMEKKILEMAGAGNDSVLKEALDKFYWEKLPLTNFGRVQRLVKPVGGIRKVQALEKFSAQDNVPFSQWVYTGDSITDSSVLEAVNRGGGLAVAFNANEYALPHATMGLASTNLLDLLPVMESWNHGGRDAVEKFIKGSGTGKKNENRENYHWLAGHTPPQEVLNIHKSIRRLVRQEAGGLG